MYFKYSYVDSIHVCQEINIKDFIPLPTGEPFSSVQISLDPDMSVVPRTLGKQRKPSDEVK